jgi:hypothetical protein
MSASSTACAKTCDAVGVMLLIVDGASCCSTRCATNARA